MGVAAEKMSRCAQASENVKLLEIEDCGKKLSCSKSCRDKVNWTLLSL